jgi:hypothetical protein
MKVEMWIFLTVAAWFGVEFGVRNRYVRVILQCLMIVVLCTVSYRLGSFMGTLEPNLRANNQLKNLTRGLVRVAGKDNLDLPLLQKRLETLDDKVIPTYENLTGSQDAVDWFLNSYGIQFEEEVPIEATSKSRRTSAKAHGFRTSAGH